MDREIDPLELKIPNICFSYCDDKYPERKAKREKFRKQRIRRGFDDSEVYELYHTLCRFMLPRMKVFRRVHKSYPGTVDEKEWENILDTIIEMMEEVVSGFKTENRIVKKYFDKDGKLRPGKKKKQFAREMNEYSDFLNNACSLFGEYMLHLWS